MYMHPCGGVGGGRLEGRCHGKNKTKSFREPDEVSDSMNSNYGTPRRRARQNAPHVSSGALGQGMSHVSTSPY